MKKFLIIIFALSFCLSGCGNKEDNSNKNTDQNTYTTQRTATSNNNTANDINDDDNSNDNTNNNTNFNSETEISSFSTKIYTPNDSARQNNLKITCSTLNGTVVKPRRNIFFLWYCRQSNTR